MLLTGIVNQLASVKCKWMDEIKADNSVKDP